MSSFFWRRVSFSIYPEENMKPAGPVEVCSSQLWAFYEQRVKYFSLFEKIKKEKWKGTIVV